MCYCWNRGWEARRPNLAGKFSRMGAGRLGGLRVFFRLGYPLRRIFDGVERRLGGLTARSSWKIRQNGGWEARRLDLAGAFTLHPPCCSILSAVKLRLKSYCSLTTEANLIKLHRKLKHNEKVCCAQDKGFFVQYKGCNQVRGQNCVSIITQQLLKQI